jgi:16S rRNA (uracil1498-N3)-methyltransferase
LTIPRIYSPIPLTEGKSCELGHDNYRYLKQVLRLEPGNRVTIFDGFGHEFVAAIKSFTADDVIVELKEAIACTNTNPIKITLAQALPKAGKMDLIVRTAAELGTDRIIPFTAARSVSRIAKDKSTAKTERWRKISQEAARCCRSAHIAEVLPLSSFENMLAEAGSGSLKMIFWEEEDQKSIKDVLIDKIWTSAKDIFIIVGPEGGLTRDEIAQASEAGFISVSLGRQILKVETAAMAIISIIQYEKGIFSQTLGR